MLVKEQREDYLEKCKAWTREDRNVARFKIGGQFQHIRLWTQKLILYFIRKAPSFRKIKIFIYIQSDSAVSVIEQCLRIEEFFLRLFSHFSSFPLGRGENKNVIGRERKSGMKFLFLGIILSYN